MTRYSFPCVGVLEGPIQAEGSRAPEGAFPHRDRNGVIFWWDPASGPPPIDAPPGSEVDPAAATASRAAATDITRPFLFKRRVAPPTGPTGTNVMPIERHLLFKRRTPAGMAAAAKAEEVKAKSNLVRQIGRGLLLTSPLWLMGLYLKFSR